jgi:hypothetical protein
MSAMSSSPGLVTRSLRLFRERPFVYLVAAALPYFTVHLLLWWLLLASPALRSPKGTPLREIMQSLTNKDLATFLLTLILWATIPYALAGRGLCRAAFSQIENRSQSLSHLAVDMVLFLPSAVFLSLIVGFAGLIGAWLLFLPGLFISAFFTLVIPAGAIENLGPFSALRRGCATAGRAYGKLLGLYLAFGSTVLATFVAQGTILSNLPPTVSARIPIIALLTCVPLLPLIIFNICRVLIFCDLRNTSVAPPPAPPSVT